MPTRRKVLEIMKTYVVYLVASVSTSVEVEVDDSDENLSEDELRSLAEDAAYEHDMPSLCAYCSGMGREWNMDLGGEWEVVEVEAMNG